MENEVSGVFELCEGAEKFLTLKYDGWEGVKHFEGTGRRLEGLFNEFCWDSSLIHFRINQCLESVFPEEYSEMLVVGPIKLWCLCPHHLIPVGLKVWVGYIPNGQVLGLSKFARVAVLLGRRPTIQEQYTRELADIFFDKFEPEGLGVWVVGIHGCMMCRGVQQESEVSTSVLKGSFLGDPTVRREFYDIVKGRGV